MKELTLTKKHAIIKSFLCGDFYDETAKQFGKELDSLVDCIAFAMVPVVCLRLAAFPSGFGLQIAFGTASFLYVLSSVTRLGYFNVRSREGEKGFTGLPTTESALLLATALLFPIPADIIWIALIILAVFMLLPIKIPSPKGLLKLLLMAWLMAVIVLHFVLPATRAGA